MVPCVVPTMVPRVVPYGSLRVYLIHPSVLSHPSPTDEKARRPVEKRFKVIVGCYVLSNPLLVINTAWSYTFGTTFSTERLGQPCGHLVCRQALSMFRNSFLFGVCGCVCVCACLLACVFVLTPSL